MAFEHLKLNQATTEMFNDISQEMKNRKIKALNVPLLLWGVLTASMEDSAYSVLENYLYTDNDLPTSEVETAISLLISLTEPKADNKKAASNKCKHRNGKHDRSNFQFSSCEKDIPGAECSEKGKYQHYGSKDKCPNSSVSANSQNLRTILFFL